MTLLSGKYWRQSTAHKGYFLFIAVFLKGQMKFSTPVLPYLKLPVLLSLY